MSYINEYNSIRGYRNNRINNNYIRNNSEGSFKRNRFLNYDKIYNQFLTSPYPPMYYQRANRITPYQYQKKLNIARSGDNYYQNNQSNEYNNLKLINPKSINDYEQNTKINSKNNYLEINPSFEEEKIKNIKSVGNENYHYKNEEYINQNQNINNRYDLSNHKNDIDMANSFDYTNQKQILNKINKRDDLNIKDMDNNRLGLSYDNIRRSYNNKGYVSPIIAQIARKNYLGNNPYTDKEQNLGPTMLKNNPILFPIDTYKFDFNRYIKDDYLNKYI